MICVLGAKFNRRCNEIKFRSSATTQQKVNLLLQTPPNLPQTASNGLKRLQTCLEWLQTYLEWLQTCLKNSQTEL